MPRTEGGDHEHWFEPLADHMGEAYLRYSFTRGTAVEVDAILAHGGEGPLTVLDVGCGPGRHALEFARRGHRVVGVDIASSFVELARSRAEAEGLADRARFIRLDARQLSFDREFDLVVSLCQGGFGLSGGPGTEAPTGPAMGRARELDETVMNAMARALKADGHLILSAFSAYFQIANAAVEDHFDADHGVNHEHTSVRNPDGDERHAELWTTCYTPRELRLLSRLCGLDPVSVFSVRPGRYRPDPPTITSPEFLLIARRTVPASENC